MKYSMARLSALALALVVLLAASSGWARQDQQAPAQGQGQPPANGQQQPGAPGGEGGRGAARGPAVSKAENDAYKAITDGRSGDPMHEAMLCLAFIDKFPMSPYLPTVYAALTDSYSRTNDTDKMIDAGNKALALNPNDVDVLPLMAFTISRMVNSKTPDGPQQLQKAQGYASHGIELLSAMAKPANLDDAAFNKGKNEKLSMCHDALGVVYVKTGKYDPAVSELNQSIQLAAMPDPSDFYLLGIANEQSDHFQDAIAAFNKCAVNGNPFQAQCKAGADDAKKKSQNSLEAPK